MNNTLKGIAIAAAVMIGAGILFTGIGLVTGGYQSVYLDRDGFHTGDSKTGGRLESFKQDTGNFDSIDVDLDYYDVELIEGDKYYVEGKYFTSEGKPEIKVENEVLTAGNNDRAGIKINLDLPGVITKDNKPVLKIYYPRGTKFKDIAIRCDMSDLEYKDIKADTMLFSLDSGKLELSGMEASSITVSMDSGDCIVSDSNAKDKLDITNDMGKIILDGINAKVLTTSANSGDVTLNGVTADKADLTVDMGKLTGKGLKTKGISASADSGDIDLEGNLTGVTDIACDLGSVTVSPGGTKEQFNYELNADMGSVSVGGVKASGSVSAISGNASNTLKISADMGSITVDFN